jgi:outer membrane protein assembly factor BamB
MLRIPIAVLVLCTGHTLATPVLHALDTPAETRSGLIVLTGTSFGLAQGSSTVLVDGLPAMVTTWSNTEVHAYVPEGASLGSVGVEISSPQGNSNSLSFNVESRQADGHLLWRFEFDSVVTGAFQAVGEDGTIYATDDAHLYALDPNGALKWVSSAAGGARPIDFLADGTVISATNLDVVALNPADGSVVWSFNAGADLFHQIQTGPNVGPDGNVYAIAAVNGTVGLGMFSLTPGGQLRWSNQGDPILDPISVANVNRIVFSSQNALLAFKYVAASPPFVFSFDQTDGDQAFTYLECTSLPRISPTDQVVFANACGVRAYDQSGSELWTSGLTNPLIPVIASDGTIYSGSFLNKLISLDTDGRALWESSSTNIVKMLGVTPDKAVVVHTWLEAFGGPHSVAGWAGDGSVRLWSVPLQTIDGHFELINSHTVSFSPSSDAAYFITRLTSNGARGGLYAVATGEPNTCPADLNGDGILDFFDVAAFLTAFAAQDQSSDLNGDGVYDFFDAAAYLASFADGCP